MTGAWVETAIAATVSAVATFFLTGVAVRLLPRVGLVSAPDPNHPAPVPVGGGIAIWLVVGILLTALGGTGHDVGQVARVFLGASVLFIAGVWDDVRLLLPRMKLLIQLGAATAMVVLGVTFPLGPELEWLAVPLTLLWFVGVTNAFNLVDNMDGMLPGVAAVASVFVGLFAGMTDRPEAALFSWIVAGACLGFLRYNLPPARIFLGDSGSMFLGFLLAGLAIGGSWRGLTNLAFTVLAPTLLLAVPIFNTTFVTVTRKLSGIPVSRGKADHINYRLIAHGLSRGRALLAVYALSAAGGSLGLLVLALSPLEYAAGASLFLIVLMYLGAFLYQARVHENYEEFQVERVGAGWEGSPWHRWVIRIVALAGDVVLVFAALYLAFLLRFDGQIPGDQLRNLALALPYLIAFRVGLALLMGIYETQWHYGLARDALRLVAAVLIGSLLFTAVLFLLKAPSFPRSVIVLEGVLSVLFFGFTRLGVRALGEVTVLDRWAREGRRTLIAGTADAVLPVYRSLQRRTDRSYNVIGFADDDPKAHRSLIGGVRVLGPLSRLPAIARLYGAQHVIFSLPNTAEDQVRILVRAALQAGLTVEVASLEFRSADEWLAGGWALPRSPSATAPPAAAG
ncbi:MAG: hypothetical protein R3E98_07800 [Gemmatimonadota bacterium]|nr:hypothetical protein [Gemmatimonadota bacterium]